VGIVAHLTTTVTVLHDKDGTRVLSGGFDYPTEKAERPLPGKSTISGRVLDTATSRPLDRVKILAWGRYRDANGVRWENYALSTVTDQQGHYAFNNMHPGAYELSAEQFSANEIIVWRDFVGSHVQAVADSMHTLDLFGTKATVKRAPRR
jgi:hypothetical protein